MHAKTCLDLYNDFQSGFGFFLLYIVFSVSQMSLIFFSFLTISEAIGSNEELWAILLLSFGKFSFTVGVPLNIHGLACILDAGYKTMRGLTHLLRRELLQDIERLERQTIEILIKEIEDTGPLNGKGFFNITRGTLTGMLSVGITYLIILVQFKMSLSSQQKKNI